MRTLIRLALPLVLLTAACGRTPQLDTRTFSLQYLSADAVHGLIEPYVYTDRADAPGSLSFTESTVTVRETADNLDKIARVLAQYDVPSPWVRLHFQLIEADVPRQNAASSRHRSLQRTCLSRTARPPRRR